MYYARAKITKRNRKKIVFAIIAIIVFAVFGLETIFVSKAQAVSYGIKHLINFQGKVVNSDGTNVADGLYRIQFNIYTVPSGGSSVWTEDRNNADKVQVTGGVFQVQLGSVTILPGSINFNTDSIYLGITFHTEGSEMTPRIQFTSVPQAFNAEKVNGLTVTNTSDSPFTSATILKIADGKTVVVNAGLTFSGTDTTTFTFPSTGGNIVTEGFTQSLTNKTIGSTGLTFGAAATDVTTGTNEDFSIVPNGSGKVNINTTSGLASFDVRANSVAGGTLAIASVSGKTSFASLVVDNSGVGDLFTASTSGLTRFTITNNGTASSSAGFTINGAGNIQSTNNQSLTIGGGSTGELTIGRTSQRVFLPGFDCSASGNGGKLTTTSGGILTCAADISGGAATVMPFDIVKGALFPANQTVDFLFGGTTTASAAFRLHKNGTDSVASIAANTSFAAFVIDQSGVGDLFTASASGATRFLITDDGAVGINTNSIGEGLKLDVVGSARIGNPNATIDDIVKSNTFDFTVAGSTATQVTTTNDKITLKLDNTASIANPSIGPTTNIAIATFSAALRRQNGKILLITGNGATTKVYDQNLSSFISGPNLKTAVASNAAAFQIGDGKFMIVHSSMSTIYDPSGNNDFGTMSFGPGLPVGIGAGARIIPITSGKTLVVTGGRQKNTAIYDPTTNKFNLGPLLTTGVASGSAVFQRPDGKWVVLLGDGSNATNIYDPSINNGGAFIAGPNLNTGIAQTGAHVFQMSDGRFMVINGGNTATTNIYDPATSVFTTGPTLVGNAGTGAHSIQRPDGKWVIILGSGTNATNLYDSTSGADGTFTRPANSDLTDEVGVGGLSFQRDDGDYVVVSGSPAKTNTSTTVFDAGWNMGGTWESEQINNTKISTYSAMFWRSTPQYNVSSGSAGLVFQVRTATDTNALSTATYNTIQTSGDLIQAAGRSNYLQIRALFNTVMSTNYMQNVPYQVQSNVWGGEGTTFYYRNFMKPTIFNMRIQNPIYGYGGFMTSDPVGGRQMATQSAFMDGVVTDNSNRITLAVNRAIPSASASAGVVIASASANLGASAGAGAVTLQLPNGKFLIILGNATGTTKIYDPVAGSFGLGPNLAGGATTTTGTVAFIRPDGNFVVCLGGAVTSQIYDPIANQFYLGPNLSLGNLGAGAHAVQRSDGKFLIFHGGVQTDIYDPVSNSMAQGPAVPIGNTLTAGSHSLRRNNGRIIVSGTNAFASNYDQDSNSFQVGAGVGNIGVGGMGYQLPSGDWIDYRGTTVVSTFNSYTGQETAGTALATTLGAGATMIPMPDGRVLILNGGAAVTSTQIAESNFTSGSIVGPTLPSGIGAGGHAFQLPNGKYMVIAGGNTSSANTMIVDVGWNMQGTYISEPINSTQLSSNTSLFWKNAGGGNISAKYRTAATEAALGTTSWVDFEKDTGNLSPNPGDTWVQVKFDLQTLMPNQPFEKSRVWASDTGGGATQYYRKPQIPILQYWRIANNTDPNILLLTNGGTNTFRFQADGQAFTSNGGAWNSGGADLAERYSSTEDLVGGEVVTQDRLNPTYTKRSTMAYDPNVMGVVSTQPGFVAGAYTENSHPIALVGRVPVKVSTENGLIKAGDYLTSASIPGYGMKATVGGRVLGQAMEDLNTDSNGEEAPIECPHEGLGNLSTTKCGTITVFVNLTSYNGESINVAMDKSGFKLDEKDLPVIPGIDFTPGTDARRQQEVLGFLKTQKDQGQGIYTDRIAATQEIISPQIITDLLVAKRIKAESIEGLDIITNSIEKLTSDQMSSGSAVNSFSDRLTLLGNNQKDLEKSMATLSEKLDKMNAINLLSFAATSTNASELVMVNNFAVYGTTTLTEASIMNTLSIGNNMTFTQNSINTIGQDLEIQPLRQGAVSFLGGLIKFDTDGKVRFAQDAEFAKNVNVAGVLSAKTVSSTELLLGQSIVKVISDTEVESTGAAGLITLKADTDHVKVNNPLVRDNSLIFITPKTKTAQSLFLLEQIEGKDGDMNSFTVGIDAKETKDVKFNYLIVN